jgi:anti-anti-sigma factor
MAYEPVLADSTAGREGALAAPFACSRTSAGRNAVWVHLAGELDIATTPQLERTLHDPQSPAELVLHDLREVAFMDTSDVHTIVSAGIHARRVGRRLILLRGPPDVDRIFALAGSSDDVENGYLDPLELPMQRSGGSLSAATTSRSKRVSRLGDARPCWPMVGAHAEDGGAVS